MGTQVERNVQSVAVAVVPNQVVPMFLRLPVTFVPRGTNREPAVYAEVSVPESQIARLFTAGSDRRTGTSYNFSGFCKDGADDSGSRSSHRPSGGRSGRKRAIRRIRSGGGHRPAQREPGSSGGADGGGRTRVRCTRVSRGGWATGSSSHAPAAMSRSGVGAARAVYAKGCGLSGVGVFTRGAGSCTTRKKIGLTATKDEPVSLELAA